MFLTNFYSSQKFDFDSLKIILFQCVNIPNNYNNDTLSNAKMPLILLSDPNF